MNLLKKMEVFLIVGLITALAAGCGGGGGGSNSPVPAGFLEVSISGVITFDFVPATQSSGLDYTSIEKKSVRGAVLEAIRNSDNEVLASTATDASGNYSFTVPAGVEIFIRVKAQLLKSGSPCWNFEIVDNTNDKALYAMDSAVFDTGDTDINDENLNASSGWGGISYTSTRVAAPFAILDTVYKALNKVLTANPSESFQDLKINWSVNNINSSGDKNLGQIGTSHFAGDDNQLYILGAEDNDTDEYDDHVMAHEWGHYFENTCSRSDSLGGSHGSNDRLDPRVAFGEGFGNGFAGIVTDDPDYIDTMGTAQSDTGITMDLQTNSQPAQNKGWYSESSIQTIIYNLYADTFSSESAPFTPIYNVLTDNQKNADSFTTIFSFISFLKDSYPSFETEISVLLSEENISTAAIDEWDSTETETNSASASNTLPVYTKLLDGDPAVTLCGSGFFGNYNKINNRKYFYFEITTAGNYTITAIPDSDGVPVIILYSTGELIGSTGSETDDFGVTQELNIDLTPGVYVGETYELYNVWGSWQEQECFEVSLD